MTDPFALNVLSQLCAAEVAFCIMDKYIYRDYQVVLGGGSYKNPRFPVPKLGNITTITTDNNTTTSYTNITTTTTH